MKVFEKITDKIRRVQARRYNRKILNKLRSLNGQQREEYINSLISQQELKFEQSNKIITIDSDETILLDLNDREIASGLYCRYTTYEDSDKVEVYLEGENLYLCNYIRTNKAVCPMYVAIKVDNKFFKCKVLRLATIDRDPRLPCDIFKVCLNMIKVDGE